MAGFSLPRPSTARIAAIACAASLAGAGVATAEISIDIRDCPIDTVTFADPWTGATFVVKRAGTDYEYLCDEGIVKEGNQDDSCRGPLGGIVLDGVLNDYDGTTRRIFSTYYILAASPCCGWAISEELENPADITWKAGDDAPRLRDLPFLAIEPDEADTELFGNPMQAVACTLR